MKLFVDGRELRYFPITQDENGFSHKNSRYSSGVLQRPIDMGSMKAGYIITSDTAVRILSSSPHASGYIVFQGSDTFQWMCVHVWKFASGVVPAGQPICRIAPKSHNGGYAVHLHISARQNYKEFFVRKLIFKDIPMPVLYKDFVKQYKKDRSDVKKKCGDNHNCYIEHFEKWGYKETIERLIMLKEPRVDVITHAAVDPIGVIHSLMNWYGEWMPKDYPGKKFWELPLREDCSKQVETVQRQRRNDVVRGLTVLQIIQLAAEKLRKRK